MTVAIEEVTAELEPTPSEPALSGQTPAQDSTSPEAEYRKHADLQVRLECRSARLTAD